MIKELLVDEKGYRGVKLPSYSLLKRVDNSGPKAIISEFKFTSEGLEFGDLLDCLLLQPEELDNKFYFEAVEKPTASLWTLTEHITENDIEISDENILELIRELGLWSNIKKEESLIKKYDNDLFWNYIDAYKESKGKTVFSPKTLDDANEAVEMLRTHDKTAYLFSETKGVESINQLKLETEIDGKAVKVMLDKVVINHNNKTITPYDLKATDVRQRSFPYIFKKMKYYLQGSLYSTVLLEWVKENYPDYVLTEFKFIVFSRSDKYPFVWTMSDSWYGKGLNGFIDYKNEKVKGVLELLDDYYYYVNSANFSIERDFVENNELFIL